MGKSKFLIALFWLSAIGCFIFGYYNSVLGLRTFTAFGSSAGSWGLAIIPLVMVFGGYYAAVRGYGKMLGLYLAGEAIFFVFNLTYLYPHYLGRTLIKEEAQLLKDSISAYDGRFDAYVSPDSALNHLREIRDNLLTEIKDRKGFGEYARKELEKFNQLAGTHYTAPREPGATQEERNRLHEQWSQKTDEGIETYLARMGKPWTVEIQKVYNCSDSLDTIRSIYSPELERIINDNSDVDISPKAVENNPQIKLLGIVTQKLDEIANDVNSVMKGEKPFQLIGGERGWKVSFPKTRKLGSFEHTLSSVSDRINKLDTWGVILVCLFFDLLGPFLFYFYLRKDDENGGGIADEGTWGRSWWERLLEGN